MTGDLLLTGIGELVTNPGAPGDLGLVPDAAVVIRDGLVAWAGPAADLPADHRSLPSRDLEGRAVLPGFVDAHTHAVFAGDRSDEFARRMRGETYEEILAAGGGIHSTVAAVRASPQEDLIAESAARLRRRSLWGTSARRWSFV